MESGVCSGKCRVWSVECVKSRVWSVKCGVCKV